MEVGPRGFMNNRYFPLYPKTPLKSSGVVLDKKGLSWHFSSWYRSCMYGHVKDPRLVFWGCFVFVWIFLSICFKY